MLIIMITIETEKSSKQLLWYDGNKSQHNE